MIIHFGLHFDGMQPVPATTSVGEVWMGPTRLLDVLELRLGLPSAAARRGEALLAYENCLAALDNDSRFYHRSFAVDAIGVARTLLDWRAQWYEAGWSGAFAGPVSQRLADMADVEQIALDRVPLNAGQRLRRIAAALDQGLNARVDRIVLHSERADLPAAWRQVLERFDVAEEPGPTGEAAEASDLERIQRTLLALADDDSGQERKPEPLAGDDSFIIVRAISRDLSAQAIGEYLLLRSKRLDSTVVIAERDGIILDNAFERVGLPRAGFQHYSPFRAVAQVLKLSLGLVWEPISPHLLLQFLIHPVGPLPDHVRSTLAEAVAAEPGVGGTAWRDGIAKIRERMLTKFERSEQETDRLVDEIRYWLECERFSPAGAPLAVLIERAQRCTTWLARRLHTVSDPQEVQLFAAAEAQGEALIAALGALHDRGDTRIPRVALERLIDEVGSRAADPGTFGQAGHVAATTEPAAITEPWETVIWWDLAPTVASLSYPWSATELDELAREGVELPPVAERIRRRMRGWLNPLMAASRQAIVVIHDRDAGNHPLVSRLLSLFENLNEIRIESALFDDVAQAQIPALELATDDLPLAPLPRPRRWWQLPPGVSIPVRANESYSSLNKLIYYPHEWVLNYAARLRAGRAADLPQGNLLYGNLAHRLFEAFFSTHENWKQLDARGVRAWLDEYLPVLVTQEGALLCEAGSGVVRQQVLSTLENAFVALLDHLRSANIETVRSEDWTEAPFRDVTLRGAIDLLLRDDKGREIVLDVKWGGESYRGSELEENRHLQLATYAYMRHAIAGGNEWPCYAYFIVSTGNVLAQDASVFPRAVVFPPATNENIASIWNRVSASYGWRREQITSGLIEVNVDGTVREPGFAGPAGTLDTDIGPDNFDDYTWLTGWAPGE